MPSCDRPVGPRGRTLAKDQGPEAHELVPELPTGIPRRKGVVVRDRHKHIHVHCPVQATCCHRFRQSEEDIRLGVVESIVESTKPKQVYGVKLVFVSERTIKDIIIGETHQLLFVGCEHVHPLVIFHHHSKL